MYKVQLFQSTMSATGGKLEAIALQKDCLDKTWPHAFLKCQSRYNKISQCYFEIGFLPALDTRE